MDKDKGKQPGNQRRQAPEQPKPRPQRDDQSIPRDRERDDSRDQ